jgi:NAD(P)H-flavin reductase
MNDVKTSTDDGSLGFHGNIVQALSANMGLLKKTKIKVFGCGPNAMLRALKTFCIDNNFECELSTESAMACGFGICQGCPIQAADKDGYYLVCKDGPVFDARKIII